MNVRMVRICCSRVGSEVSYPPMPWVMLPVALHLVGYHHLVSSMRAYYGEERRASRAILGGTLDRTLRFTSSGW